MVAYRYMYFDANEDLDTDLTFLNIVLLLCFHIATIQYLLTHIKGTY